MRTQKEPFSLPAIVSRYQQDVPVGYESVRELFSQVQRKMSLQEIADWIGLHRGTVKRWLNTGVIPMAYEGDFLRMLDKDGNITITGNKVRDKDQFYTKPDSAQWCVDRFNETMINLDIDLNQYTFIEPSAGCGWFYNLMPQDRRLGIDIDPQGPIADRLIRADYLRWSPPQGNYIVLGNPPFGLRGHLALQFINHSTNFADVTAFVLPQLFVSDGKGVPAKRVDNRYKRICSVPMPSNSFTTPEGKDMNINTVFQIWSKVNLDKLPMEDNRTCDSYIRVYSLSDGGTPASTRNKKMLYNCDVYLPSTCFTNMQAYKDFEDLPHRRGYGILVKKNREDIVALLMANDWERTAFPSTNGALNLRSSIIKKVVTEGGFYD